MGEALKNLGIKTGYFSLEMPKAQDKKISFNLMIVHLYIRIKLYVIHNFSVWLRTGSNPQDINRFRSHTGKWKIRLSSLYMCETLRENTIEV